MFLIETSGSKAARRTAWLMAVLLLLLLGQPYLLFTLHFYRKPSPPIPRGFRIFGFPKPPLRS
jgi:hypothetical protein